MLNIFLEKLIQSTDRFVTTIECPELHPGGELWHSTLALCETLRRRLPENECANVELGILYLRRLYSDEAPSVLISRIERVRASCDSPVLRLKADFVEAVLRLMLRKEYCYAATRLEQIASEAQTLRFDFVFGLAARALGATYMFLGRHQDSEHAYINALSSFTRFDHALSRIMTLNDHAVLLKKTGRLHEAKAALREVIRFCDSEGMHWLRLLALVNTGSVVARLGEWESAERDYRSAIVLREKISRDAGVSCEPARELHTEIDLGRMASYRRRFDESEQCLLEARKVLNGTRGRQLPLAEGFLGGLYTETARYRDAHEHLDTAYAIAVEILPQSDVMTEVLRHQAELLLRTKDYVAAKATALRCASLCKKIGDRYELGAVLRILGQVHVALGDERRATATFEVAIHTLKSVHECYELMRTSLAYGVHLVDRGHDDGETRLIEARQLSRKLELEFFEAQVEAHLVRHMMRIGSFDEARSHMDAAERLYEKLQSCDRDQVKPLLERTRNGLDQAILKTSVANAEELKTLCRVYEEARFPMEDMRADLAYQVAQSVGADSLFLVRRWKRGYDVALSYNLPGTEAKEIVRRQDRDRTVGILGVDGEPRVLTSHTDHTLVVVPAPGSLGFVLCTQFNERRAPSPRQFEFLLAGAEALERLALEELEPKAPAGDDGFIEGKAERLAHPRGSFKKVLTMEPEMIRLIHLAERASTSRAPILLQGETGVGKELFARAIHDASPRRDAQFVAINAGGMPVQLLESQLFGHVRGAYTDATTDRKGLIEDARGGTIFLDEVGEMGEEAQVKFLRLLENGEYRRLGENDVHKADVRIVSATNRELTREVERRAFRKDLYYRLGALTLSIPPLRQRKRDIPLLVRHFLRECAVFNGLGNRTFQIDVKAVEALELYNWPGNVRELYNEVLRIVSLIGNAETIRFAMLSDGIKAQLRSRHRADGLLEQTVEHFERRLILDALQKNDWNRLRTAEEVGIPRTTLLAKMKRLNIATR